MWFHGRYKMPEAACQRGFLHRHRTRWWGDSHRVRFWPEGHVSWDLAQGKILRVLWDDSSEVLQSLRHCDSGLVVVDPYHHAAKYHVRLTRRFYPWLIPHSSKEQRLVAQVLIIFPYPVLGIFQLPLNHMIRIDHQHWNNSDHFEHLVHVEVEIHIQPIAQP